MEVRTTVTVTDKEIRDLILDKAKSLVKTDGASTIEIFAEPTEREPTALPVKIPSVSATVSFQKQNAR